MSGQTRDAILDAAAIAEALAAGDDDAAALLLRYGDPAAIATVLGGWVAAALAIMGTDRAAVTVAAWRAMGEDRGDGWADYSGPPP